MLFHTPVRRDNPRTLARGLSTYRRKDNRPIDVEIIPSFTDVEIIPELSEGIIDRTGAQTMLYLTCTMISSVDLAHYGVSRAKDWVSVIVVVSTYRLYSDWLSFVYNSGKSVNERDNEVF